MARQGIVIDRSVLASWVGYAAVEAKPLWRLMCEERLGSTKLFVDEFCGGLLSYTGKFAAGGGRSKCGESCPCRGMTFSGK